MTAFIALGLLYFSDVGSSPDIDFDTHVMPVLTRSGCNSGACHGAAVGRGGFRLSLYGSRPAQDFEEISLALEGRRLNHQTPGESLLLKKPTEMVEHGGGLRLALDGPGFQILHSWIHQGARRTQRRRLVDFRFSSTAGTVVAANTPVQLSARAVYSDDSVDDVLDWVVVTPSDPATGSVDRLGRITVTTPGRHLFLARFLNQVVPLELIVPIEQRTPVGSQNQTPSIDSFIEERLNLLQLDIGEPATDFTLIRRLYLDLTGRLPTPNEVMSYVQSHQPAKTSALIDKLLASEEFTDYQTFRAAQLLKLNSLKPDNPATHLFYDWLREMISRDSSYADMIERLILGEGAVEQIAPANFYTVTGDPRLQAEFVSQQLLGIRMQCANCHDHPLDRWTQDDYHGLAAIFAGIKRGPIVGFTSGNVIHPGTGEAAIPKLPGSDFLPAGKDHRRTLARWITSSENPLFSQSIVNRIWAHLMGRGLVEATDDLRVTNPATHPELLHWLSKRFVASGYRLRSVYRDICRSEVYRRKTASAAEELSVPEYYAHAISKNMPPEIFLDAISDVTGVASTINGEIGRAVSPAGLAGTSSTLDLLGRCTKDELCNASGIAGSELTLQLHLLNGDLLNNRIAAPDGRLMQSLHSPPLKMIDEFYLRALSRKPTPSEVAFWMGHWDKTQTTEEKASLAQDFLWALLSSEEFRTIR